VDRVVLPNGRSSVREVVRHPGAAAIVPLLPDGRVLLVEQYRYAPNSTLLEIPAGTIDAGETPRECAERELREETGYAASRWTRLAAFLAAPGTMDEVITVFLASGLRAGARSLDDDEAGLALKPTEFSAALDLVRRGRIRDGKSIIGLLLAADRGRSGPLSPGRERSQRSRKR
jgi:ADP-ribose pyrophosphatase